MENCNVDGKISTKSFEFNNVEEQETLQFKTGRYLSKKMIIIFTLLLINLRKKRTVCKYVFEYPRFAKNLLKNLACCIIP